MVDTREEGGDGAHLGRREVMVHIWEGGRCWCISGEEGGDGVHLGRREVMVHIWEGGR